MSVGLRGHQRIDQPFSLHRAIADKLRENPALLENRPRQPGSLVGCERPFAAYWDAWRGILRLALEEFSIEWSSNRRGWTRCGKPLRSLES
jgi:hypothetical protein